MLIQTLLSLALTLAPAVAGAPVVTEDLLGVWLTEDSTMAVEIAPCGEDLCGKVVWLSDDADGSVAVGAEGLSNLSGNPDEEGNWTGGKVYCAETDKTYYKARVTIENPDRIELKGFAGVMHNRRLVTSRFDTRLHWTRSSREALAGS